MPEDLASCTSSSQKHPQRVIHTVDAQHVGAQYSAHSGLTGDVLQPTYDPRAYCPWKVHSLQGQVDLSLNLAFYELWDFGRDLSEPQFKRGNNALQGWCEV